LYEKKATIGSYDVDFDVDFTFIGTMNPEDTSTERMSDVLLDRFDIIYIGYPETEEIEKEIILKNGKDLKLEFSQRLLNLMIKFIRELRADEKLEKKPSVRASLGLYERAQANALVRKDATVCFKDIKEAVISVLGHRISLKPSVKYLQDPGEYVKESLSKFIKREKIDADCGDSL
jgi:MoxR-like ATPase